MNIPQDATVAVVDGRKLNLFHNTDTGGGVALKALPEVHPKAEGGSAGNRHHDSAANPSQGQSEEDDFAVSVAAMLNAQVQSGKISRLVVVAAPKTLGELRKHFTKQVSASLAGEVSKDLAGHPIKEIEKVIAAA